MDLEFAVEPAGADGDVGAVTNSGEEEFCLGDGSGEVGIGEHDDFALGFEQAVADAEAFAVIAGVFKESDFGVGLGEAKDLGGG